MKYYSLVIIIIVSINILTSKASFIAKDNSISVFDSDTSRIRNVKYYFMEWQKRRRFAVGFNQIKDLHEFYSEISGDRLCGLYNDYDDCLTKLYSNDTILRNKTFLNSLVEINFVNGKTIDIYFDIKGNYYYNQQWYKINNDLYYNLFRYFSDVIIPKNVLRKAKEE